MSLESGIAYIFLSPRSSLIQGYIIKFIRWSETQKLKILIIDNYFLLPFDGNETFYSR